MFEVSSFRMHTSYKGVFIATQLNATQLSWTQLTQLNSVQLSQSCFCIRRQDLQTESTGSLRSLIGDSCSRCERVDNSTSSWIELRRRSVYSRFHDKRMNTLHFGSDPADIIRIPDPDPVNPEIRIWISDHFWLRFWRRRRCSCSICCTRNSAVAERPRHWIFCYVTQGQSRSFEVTLLRRSCMSSY